MRAAAGRVSVPAPECEGRRWAARVRWGLELETRPLEAAAGEASKCAGYIAKYATKSTEVVGGLTYRLGAGDIAGLRVRDHVRRYVECAWRLGGDPDLRELRLRRWAHTLGFRGHCFTKSRRYSTTFTALRRARHEHVLRRAHPKGRRDPWGRPVGDGASREWSRFSLVGIGYRTRGRRVACRVRRARAREERQVAREELRAARRGSAGEQRSMTRLEVGMVQERYITAREVAERVGLSPDTILRYYRGGQDPRPQAPGHDPAGPVPVERDRGARGTDTRS